MEIVARATCAWALATVVHGWFETTTLTTTEDGGGFPWWAWFLLMLLICAVVNAVGILINWGIFVMLKRRSSAGTLGREEPLQSEVISASTELE